MKHRLLLGLLATAMSPALWSASARADERARIEDDQQKTAGDIVVTGAKVKQADEHQSASATGLALSIRETPQSVTVIDKQRIQDFALTNVNDLLAQTVGINVERVETDRTLFNARGYDVTNFQVDGIGLPLFSGLQTGDLDTVLFERVETVRGANAIMTGIGNPSATINYLRKRPTATLQAHAAVLAGSWDQQRAEADVSGPVNASGTVQARLIFAHEDRDSYLDYNHVNRDVYGALLSWDVTPRLKATVGYTRQDNRADGVLWGSLPLTYSDGSRIDYARSASTSADWTYWNVLDQTAFGELAYDVGGGWSVRGVFTYRDRDETAKLLYGYGYPDRTTGLGINGMAGIYPSEFKQYLYDGYASGPLTLFGREHQLAFGVSHGRNEGTQYEGFSSDLVAYPAVGSFGTVQPVEPSFPDIALAADTLDKLTRVYGAAHLNITDRLKAVVGASAMWLTSSGQSYGVDQSRDDSKVSPYAGLLFDLTPNVTLYASYTDIFNPQTQVDVNNRKLAPAKGTSIEGGIKSEWLGGRLYVAASLFRARQTGLADFAGTFGADGAGQAGGSYYTGIDSTAKGAELEVAGRVSDRWTLSGGFTHLSIEGDDGNPARTFIPRDTLKLATTYTVPELRDLKLGAQLRFQSRISQTDSGVTDAAGNATVLRQGSYAVLDLLAGMRVADHLRASVNLRNVTNTKYLNSLQYAQSYYAAPRSAIVSLSFDY